MGDCGNLRCVQEKRHFRRELASWYKKIPYTIGLELLAKNIAGNASGHIKTLLLPFNDMEPDEPSDFPAFEDSPCIYCDGKPTAESSEQENIPEDLSGAELVSPDQMLKGVPKQLFSETMKETLETTPSMVPANPQLTVLEGLNSFYNQLAMTSLMYQQQQLQNAAVQAAMTAGTSSSSQPQAPAPAVGLQLPSKELALDLQGVQCEVANRPLALTPESGSLKVPEIRNKKKKDNQLKRTYTDRELNAAVEAIKSGSVGTRRAAQMYGVPRSTLRNKVFKSAEMSRQLPYNRDSFTESTEGLDESCHSPTNKSNSESGASSPSSKETSPKDKTCLESKLDMSQHNSAALKQLEELQAKQGFSDQIAMMSQQNRLLGDLFNPLNFAPTSYPFFMPQYSALSTVPGFDYMNPYASSMLLPYLPEMMKSLTQKQIEMERLNQNPTTRHHNSSRKLEINTRQVKKEDIRVPAYKPSTSHMVSEHDIASKVAKSMIKKESVDRFPELTRAFSTNEYTHISHSPSTSKRSSPLGNPSPRKKSLVDQPPSQVQPSHSITNGSSTGKKRPKRGQYRKYDSERLADAVKAVQRGEMSVHRAGTHYGVPHSTLEYKVKERHLLRKKKIAESGENKLNAITAANNKAASAVTNGSLESNQSAPKLPRPHSSQPATEPTTANEENKHTFMDFSPSPFPMDAPASELLLKLQARAQRQQAVSQNNESLGSLA